MLSPVTDTDQGFCAWLDGVLAAAAFGAVSLGEARRRAREDLGLGDESFCRRLVRATAQGGRFRSDGEIVWQIQNPPLSGGGFLLCGGGRRGSL